MKNNPYLSLKIRAFRLFLIGRLFIFLALQVQILASSWQVYSLTKNPLYLGLIGLSVALPAIGVSLYAGHLSDFIERKLIVIVTAITLMASMIMLIICSIFIKNEQLLLCLIFIFVTLTGLSRGFLIPSLFGLLSDIVPRKLYGSATAINSAARTASSIFGPVMGGFMYTWSSAASTYFVAALFLLLSIICLLRLQLKSVAPIKQTTSVLESIKEGLSFVRSNQVILGAMALDLFAVLFGGAVALLPVFVSEIFHQGPEMLGILRAAPSVGALLAAVTLAHRPIMKHAGVILLITIAGFGISMIGFGLCTNVYFSLLLLSLSGIFDNVSVYIRSTIYQLSTPNEMKGRISAINSIFIYLSNEIGEFESGVTAKLMGLVPSVVFGGCMTLSVVLITALKAPKLRRLHMQDLYNQ